jgi:hypothetical protein
MLRRRSGQTWFETNAPLSPVPAPTLTVVSAQHWCGYAERGQEPAGSLSEGDPSRADRPTAGAWEPDDDKPARSWFGGICHQRAIVVARDGRVMCALAMWWVLIQ